MSNRYVLSSTARFTPPPGGRYTKAKDDPRPDTEAEGGASGGGAKTAPQSRGGREAQGAVTGAAEGRMADTRKADDEAAGAGGRGTGEDDM